MSDLRPHGAIDPVPAGVSVHGLVPAAGSGERFGSAKQFLEVGGRPLLCWTLERLLAGGVESIVVALPPAALERGLEGWPADRRVRFVAGGETRQASVAAALAASSARPSDLIAVHDGARAGIDPRDVRATVAAARSTGGAVLGRAVTDTIKQTESGRVVATVDRRRLFRAETPQVFSRQLLERALECAARDLFVGSDEASLVERLGEIAIAAVEAERPNPKLTFADDLRDFQRLLELPDARRGEMNLRIGQGYDVHRLVAGRKLILGGEEIPFELGLEGHSDADVLLHALGDALLGAAGLGDLGTHFPPSDPAWRGASSVHLLSLICERVRAAGFRPVNCDLTLIAEAPRLAPYRDRIRARLAPILGVEPGAIGLKATTHEQLGTIGRGEGMAAMAVALLESAEPSA